MGGCGWRSTRPGGQRGYGSYLVKEVLQQNGGYDVKRETHFTAGPAADEAAGALLKKFGFLPQGGEMVRRRVPDLSAVQLCHEFLTAHLQPGGLYVDATCGNGHDTEFLCRLAGPTGRVLALDIQPAAVENTNTRLGAAGLGAIGRALVHDHARLAELVAPGTADCVLFNFGWLPGRRPRGALHRRWQSARPAGRAGCPEAARCAGGGAVQRTGHR